MGALWAWGLCALVHPAWVSLVDGWVAVCPIGIQRGSTNGANVVAAHCLGATGCSAGQHVGQGQWSTMGASGMCTPWVVYRKQQVLGGCVGDKWRPSGGAASGASHLWCKLGPNGCVWPLCAHGAGQQYRLLWALWVPPPKWQVLGGCVGTKLSPPGGAASGGSHL